MCGRFTSTSPMSALAEAFAVDEVTAESLAARYNVAPTQPVPVVAVRRGRDGNVPRRVLGTMRWGLVPSWARDPSVGSRMINARAEGIADKPAYRSALLRRRCIIPADGFYEWQTLGPGPDGRKRAKLPWVIRRADGAPMAFAGLWETWRDRSDPDAVPLRTAVIITTSANEALAPIHDRMPAVLDPSSWATWLDPAVDDRDTVEALLVTAPPSLFAAHPVGTRVNKVDQDGPDLVDPVDPPPNSA
jgi:putative SOS response-associated peptidase YedK